MCGISFGVDTRGWGPAGNTGRGYSRLRSGREHWAWMAWLRSGREHWAGMVVVEVRQGTLGRDGRGWGPAGNTGRGWSWLRSGSEHCGSQLTKRRRTRLEAAGGRRRRKDAGGGRQEEEEATDIKSNNPHLAGGEQKLGFKGSKKRDLPSGTAWLPGTPCVSKGTSMN